MSEKVERWAIRPREFEKSGHVLWEMQRVSDGGYVRYDDYAALLAANESLAKDAERLRGERDRVTRQFDSLRSAVFETCTYNDCEMIQRRYETGISKERTP